MISPLIDRLIDLALEEDLGPGDVTTQALIPPELQGEAHIRAKADLVVAGLPVAARVFHKLDRNLVFEAAGSRRPGSGARHGPGPPHRPRGLDPHRRAGGPQFSPAPLGHRHLDPGHGGPGSRLTCGFGGHPENHPGLAGPGEIRGAPGRRPQSPPGTLRRGAHQEQSPDRGGGNQRGRGSGPKPGPIICSRSKWK